MEDKKMFITAMFPYPSGSGLHCGHWYNYSIVDSFCNYKRFMGNEVFQPFGFDSFGLPAENYAKKIGGDVKEITEANISNFTREIERMNTRFDIKFSTHSKDYQNRTQWLFTELYSRGLAYKAFREENYCSCCETVLAREQVKDEKCERCGTETTKKNLEQWFFKITDYKQRLIDDLDKVDYPEKTKKQQRNWLENLTDWCVSRQRMWGCPIPIEGETDTLDTFVDSSFYTIEYDRTRPVDIYVGGNEHATMHLIYSRFICKFLFDIGYIEFDEPYNKLIHQGMILLDGEKMSKSKGNVVNLDNYDSDEIRFYLMFIGHYFDGGNWSDQNINGIKRFINKMVTWLNETGDDVLELDDFKTTIFNFTEAWKFNKVVSSFMILLKENKSKRITSESKEEILELLELYMPNIRSKF